MPKSDRPFPPEFRRQMVHLVRSLLSDKSSTEPGQLQGWHHIASGKPVQNAFVESFNGRLHNELLEGDGSAFYRRRREC